MSSSKKTPYGQFYHKYLTIQKTTSPKQKPTQLHFGKDFTDHMLEVEWNRVDGWSKPRIVPYHPLSLDPACSVLHYAIECFEGMKAYLSTNGNELLFFRPEMNAKRLNDSAKRLMLPTFDEVEFLKCLAELVKVDKDWIPMKRGYSLYLRPTMISTEPCLPLVPPGKALLYVIMTPSGPYYPKPVKLYANPEWIRAWPNGTGSKKIGANYAPSILPQVEAEEKGCDAVLWVHGEKQIISEVGTMNIMIYWKNTKGEEELVTPALDGTVLPGITRDTILQLAKEWGIKTVERIITMGELLDAIKQERVLEIFGTGTAAIVCSTCSIYFKGVEYKIPVPEKGIAKKFGEHIMSIQYGEIESPFCVKIRTILNE